MSQKYREFSVEFKLKAVERVASGCKVQPLACAASCFTGGKRRSKLVAWRVYSRKSAAPNREGVS